MKGLPTAPAPAPLAGARLPALRVKRARASAASVKVANPQPGQVV